MRERLIAGIKKLTVIALASAMLLGVVPIGLVSRSSTVSAEGEFLRLAPAAETFVASGVQARRRTGAQIYPQGCLVGDGYDAYLRFDLQSLRNWDLEEVHWAGLRLTALQTASAAPVPMKIWLMPDNDWDTGMTYADRPTALGEVKLAETALGTGAGGPELLETDLTAYVKKWIAEGREAVSLHLTAPGAAFAALAGTECEDPVYRPCLKVVTGAAVDPDRHDLTKVWLEESAALGSHTQAEPLGVGGGTEAYLRFRFQRENIQGAVYQALLRLRPAEVEPGAALRVSQVLCGGWDAGTISPDNRPAGEELTAYGTDSPEPGAEYAIDLTDLVDDTLAREEDTITLRLTGGEAGRLTLDGAPTLELRVSDDPRVQAVTQAAALGLGENQDANAVTENLLETYTSQEGVRAEVRWKAADPDTGLPLREILRPNGEIQRPRWFEGARRIRADAVITSGGKTRERGYFLTVLPEEAPDYANESFTNVLQLGKEADELRQRLEAKAADVRNRWLSGQSFTCRSLEPEGALVLNLACDPEAQNYLTLKFWEDDMTGTGLSLRSLQEPEADTVALTAPAEPAGEKDAFLYRTYALPLQFTQGREYVSLLLTAAPDGDTPQEIYGAYLTQTPYFDPFAFADKGETTAGRAPTADGSLYGFLKRLYAATQQPIWSLLGEAAPGPDALTDSAAEAEDATAVADTLIAQEGQAVVFRDGGERIAVSMNPEAGTADIHRSSLYYDAYCATGLQAFPGLTAVDYGAYEILQNRDIPQALPWQSLGLSGVYCDLAGGGYYAFLQPGEMADDSVLPPGAQLLDGGRTELSPGQTMVLALLAPPLCRSDWRISHINGRTASQVKLTQALPIRQATIRNVGRTPDTGEALTVLCGIYQRGILVRMERREITAVPGQAAYEADFSDAGLVAQPGQTVKLFVEPRDGDPQTMQPKLELP